MFGWMILSIIISVASMMWTADWFITNGYNGLKLIPRAIVIVLLFISYIPVLIIAFFGYVLFWYGLVFSNMLIFLIENPFRKIVFKMHKPKKYFDIPYHKWGKIK